MLKNSQRELRHLQLRSLSHWHMDLTTQALQDPHVHVIADSKSKLLNLPHLRLYNIEADLIWSCLATTIDFTNLKTLALYNCEIDNFCEKFVSSLNGRSTALEHVYATIIDEDFISDLLVCSENLTSLHLIWTGSCTFKKFWSMIERRGPGLKSLGMQHLYAVDGDWDDSLLRLLSICRNVQHLRIPIPFDVMKYSTWKRDDDYEDFVVSRIPFRVLATWLTFHRTTSSKCRSCVQYYSRTMPFFSPATATATATVKALSTTSRTSQISNI
jgi:hypothetical protein